MPPKSKLQKNKELFKKVFNIGSHLGNFAIISAFAYIGNLDVYYGTLSVMPSLLGIVLSIVQNVAPDKIDELKKLAMNIIDNEDDDNNIKKFLDDITEYSYGRQNGNGLTITSEPIEDRAGVELMNAYIDRAKGVVELTPRQP